MLQKNKKKAQGFHSEAIIAVICIIFIAVALSYAMFSVNDIKQIIKASPKDLSYDYPAVFVHTFLNSAITELIDEKILEEYNIDTTENKQVKDLIWLDTKESLELVNKARLSYLEKVLYTDNKGRNMNDFYSKFSGQTVSSQDLIHIVTGASSLTKLSDIIEENNYYFYIKTSKTTIKANNYAIIYFKNPSISQTQSNPDSEEEQEGISDYDDVVMS